MPNTPDALFCVGCGAAIGAEAGPAVAPPLPQGRRRRRSMRRARHGVAPAASPTRLARPTVSTAACRWPTRSPPIRSYAPASIGVYPGGATNAAIAQHIYIGVAPTRAEVPLLARALWFVFIGLWVGQVWLVLAWLLNLTLIGLPLGMWMLSRLPQVMTLRSTPIPQRPPIGVAQSTAHFAVRAVYFVLIGWWVSFLWMQLAWLIAATVIGLPLSFLMFERVATLTTLAET